MKQLLHHLFLPHFSNNQRAKLLHHSSLLLIIIVFFLGQFAFSFLKTDYPAVLGTSIDISTEKLLDITNQDRAKQHLSPLKINTTLSQAASLKADFMFEKNFWAHNSPDGTTPWYFFKKVGYNYVYAGENLARGFTDSSDVVTAWMNSPTHRENMLSPNYKEIGFAIKQGKLLGEDTTLVVELFGSTDTTTVAKTPKQTTEVLPAATQTQEQSNTLESILSNYRIKSTSLIDGRSTSTLIGFFILGLFIMILTVDIIVIERKNIVRFVGHSLDHILFLSAILVIMVVTLKGLVL